MGIRFRFASLILAVLLAGGLPPAALAASWLDANAHNGIFFSATGTAAFSGASSVDSVSANASQFVDTEVSGGPNRDGTTVNFGLGVGPMAPSSGTGTASGDLGIALIFGDTLNPDRLDFHFSGVVSATSAQTSSAEAADAGVGVKGDVNLSIAPITAAPGTVLGYLNLGTLAGLDPFSSLLLEWRDFAGVSTIPTITSLPIGAAPLSLALVSDHSYQLHFDFNVLVPNGIDPPFDYSFSTTVSETAVPLPGSLWLLLSALGLVLGRTGTGRRLALP